MSGTKARNVIAQELRTHRLERCTTSTSTESIQWWQCAGCAFKSCIFPIRGMQWEVLQQEIAADHLAVQIDTALGGLTQEAEQIPVFVVDSPERLILRGLEMVPATHVEFIAHTRLKTVWHGNDCPDCASEYGVHDRRQAEMQAAAQERAQ